MSMVLFHFAHDQSFHSDDTSNLEHYLTTPFLVPVLIIGTSFFIYLLLTKLFQFSIVGTIQTICGLYLIAGIGLIRYSPILSAVLFTVGCITTLIIVLLSLQDSR
jgi:hypothetical protein